MTMCAAPAEASTASTPNTVTTTTSKVQATATYSGVEDIGAETADATTQATTRNAVRYLFYVLTPARPVVGGKRPLFSASN